MLTFRTLAIPAVIVTLSIFIYSATALGKAENAEYSGSFRISGGTLIVNESERLPLAEHVIYQDRYGNSIRSSQVDAATGIVVRFDEEGDISVITVIDQSR